MIEITALTKKFDHGRQNEVTGLNNLNIQINKGEFVVLLGANGSGKSTLLNTIAGNIFPTTGSIKIGGTDVTRYADYQRSRWIARVFQNPLQGTAADLSILENFRMASLRTARKKLSIGLSDQFRLQVKDHVAVLGMGLENKLHLSMGTLSGGQRQALTLLMAVMDDLDILLLDEPVAALDPRSAELVMKTADRIIREFNLTALMVTHQLKDAINYGTRIIQLDEGMLRRDIGKEEKSVLKPEDIYQWFS